MARWRAQTAQFDGGWMQPFQIDFNGVLPEPALADLSRAMYLRVANQYGASASCHVSMSCSRANPQASTREICARVHVANGSVSASAESSHTNPVRAMRSAFERVCLEMDAERLIRTRPRTRSGSRLLLIGRSSGRVITFARPYANQQLDPSARRSRGGGPKGE